MSWNASTSASSYTFWPGFRRARSCRKCSWGPWSSRSAHCIARERQPRSAIRPRAAFSAWPGSAFAPREFGQHVGRAEAVPGEQHQAMEPQVGDFGGRCGFYHRPWPPSRFRSLPRRSSSGSRRRPSRTARRRRTTPGSAPLRAAMVAATRASTSPIVVRSAIAVNRLRDPSARLDIMPRAVFELRKKQRS